MTQEKLNDIIKLHQMWLNDEVGGIKADLSYTDLSGVDLSKVNLSDADLSDANLSYANLSYANLSYADLSGTTLFGANLSGANLSETVLSYTDLSFSNLSGANLSGANLSYATLYMTNLSKADLSYANLHYANLFEANLSYANLSYANLSKADLSKANLSDVITDENTKYFNLKCPAIGSFIGYKKCRRDVIVTLKITEDALRSSATGDKCRCSKAEVLDIEGAEEAISKYDNKFIYHKGDIVEVKDFNQNRWIECTSGIHFFMTKEEAIKY